MTANKKAPVLVVLQMSGAYDALNTFIPYSDPLYMDYRPVLKVEPEQVLHVDDHVGFHPAMAPLKALYDEGKVAVLQGIGYPNPIRSGPVNDYLSQTGLDALKGADILTSAPQMYSSTLEYNRDLFAQWLKNIAQVHLADFGTRILYTGVNPGTFDTHANQSITFPKLWNDVTSAVSTFYQDLKEHQANEEVVILMFTEFGRRVKENGSGTDHGSGGVAFVIGDAVKGGLYGEYPSLKPEKLDEGDLQWNNDFRSTYATLLEQWMGLDSKAILRGSFEQLDFIK